jgi:FkbM family methyltransferase
MRFIKKIIVEIIHSLGFDIVRIPKDFNNPFLGLNRFSINTIIDIGANKGQFAEKALKAFPHARIYCFEPLPEALNELEKLAKKENLSRVKTLNLALGNREGEVQMFHHLDHNDSSSLLKTTKLYESYYPITKKRREISVHLATLDKVAEKNPELSVPEILIKVDTEGYEKFVIEGGKNL